MAVETLEQAANFLYDVYGGLHRAHGVYNVNGIDAARGKVKGRAETVREVVTTDKWLDHLRGKQGLGIIPIRDDAMVRWGAVDIDKYPLDHADINRRCEQLNLPTLLLRSKSGGAHVTIFAKDPVPAALMRQKMMQIGAALGYPSVEIYPKQVQLASTTDIGNWLNMPYFDYEKTDRYCIFRGKKVELIDFCNIVEKFWVTEEELEALQIRISDDFTDGPPCLQLIAREGLKEGSRNQAMFAFGVYTRLKHGDLWEPEFEKLNAALCVPPLPSKEMVILVKSLGKKKYYYPCKQRPCADYCNKELCRTRPHGIGQAAADDELDVQLGRLVKVNHADKPTYIIDVDGVRFELEADDMMVQPRFHRVCIEKINKWPKLVSSKAWQSMINTKLQDVEIIEPPKDSSLGGVFVELMTQFLTSTSLAREQEELLTHKPWDDTEAGRTYFRSTDLFAFLERNGLRGFSQKKAWDILRAAGAEHKQMNVRGRNIQVWSVVTPQRQTESFSQPAIDNREY